MSFLIQTYHTTLQKQASVNTNSTDILPLLNGPSSLVKVVLDHQLHYSPGTSFYFEGQEGVVDYEKLKGHISDRASSADGT